MKEISLYIHIPFCAQKCFYCDFPSFSGKENLRKVYIDALIKELRDRCSSYIIKTIFIGGGTPSYLEVGEIEKLLTAINELNLKETIEFTMECNPGTLNIDKLKVMKSGKVNRISFGLQSCEDDLLKKIGRIHTFNDFIDNYNLARQLGFSNINVDLMYGLPNQSVENWKSTLKKICYIKPDHISAYSLIIEEGTLFYSLYDKDKLILPTEDEEREMDYITKKILKENGYNQYEISNYSLEGKECKHNKVYWTLEEYIAVGTACSSYIDGYRLENINDIDQYIKKINLGEDVVINKHKNSIEDEIEEFVFMGLRMNKGINISRFKEKFNRSIDSIYKEVIEKNIERKLIKIDGNRMLLTTKGMELSNEVMSDFILEKANDEM